MKDIWLRYTLVATLLFSATFASAAADPAPGPREKCSVCGMFVAKYPNWTASVVLADGSRRYFDGVKDMLKLYLSPEKYGVVGGRSSVADIRVKDYYTLEMMDGRQAFYVSGSDVYGPMGKELVPFARHKDAKEFLRDHRGKAILLFKDLNGSVLRQLE